MQNFIKIYQKVQGIGPVSLFSESEPRQNRHLSQISFDNLIGYILSISMCMQNFIITFFTVLDIGPFSFIQLLELGKASTEKKSHFAICMQNFITIFHSVQEIAPLSLFQNLELGKASTNEKYHFAISWARSCQYQCLRNSLSKYSTQFKR